MKRKIIFLGLFIFAAWTHAQENAVTNTYQNKGSKNYIKITKTGTTYTAEGKIFGYPIKNATYTHRDGYVCFKGDLENYLRTFGQIEFMIAGGGKFLAIDVTDTNEKNHPLIIYSAANDSKKLVKNSRP